VKVQGVFRYDGEIMTPTEIVNKIREAN